jgi:hypothetical protein
MYTDKDVMNTYKEIYLSAGKQSARHHNPSISNTAQKKYTSAIFALN